MTMTGNSVYPYGNSYICSICGTWVSGGLTHTCYASFPNTTTAYTFDWWSKCDHCYCKETAKEYSEIPHRQCCKCYTNKAKEFLTDEQKVHSGTLTFQKIPAKITVMDAPAYVTLTLQSLLACGELIQMLEPDILRITDDDGIIEYKIVFWDNKVNALYCKKVTDTRGDDKVEKV